MIGKKSDLVILQIRKYKQDLTTNFYKLFFLFYALLIYLIRTFTVLIFLQRATFGIDGHTCSSGTAE